MRPVEFEPTISAGERPQTYALDRRPLGPANNNIAEKINNFSTLLSFIPQRKRYYLLMGAKLGQLENGINAGCQRK
jgi:hypothetical protein